MKFSVEELAKMFDVSCVKADVTIEELNKAVALVHRYPFACAFALPCFMPWLAERIQDCPETKLGGTVGFPSGAETTATKVIIAKEAVSFGCEELDMVINIGALKSNLYDTVYEDIRSVVDVAGDRVCKAILEVAYLTDYEIQKGCELAAKAGITFVKSGTGWAAKPTELRHIELMKKTVGDSVLIKAAGGVRTLATVESFIEAGCTRFGIGIKSIEAILKEAENQI